MVSISWIPVVLSVVGSSCMATDTGSIPLHVVVGSVDAPSVFKSSSYVGIFFLAFYINLLQHRLYVRPKNGVYLQCAWIIH